MIEWQVLSQYSASIAAVIALPVAVAAAVLAFLSYNMKRGYAVRGSISIGRSYRGSEDRVSRIYLDNLKDRAVVIFFIYIEIAKEVYLELADFKERPKVIGPFQSVSFDFDEVDHYVSNLKSFDLNEIFTEMHQHRFNIYLSTPDGRVRVEQTTSRWDPVLNSVLGKARAVVIEARRLKIDQQVVGNFARYAVKISAEGMNEVIPIYPRDEARWGAAHGEFSNPATIERFFLRQTSSDNRKVAVAVIDLDERRKRWDAYNIRERKTTLRYKPKPTQGAIPTHHSARRSQGGVKPHPTPAPPQPMP